MSRRHRAIGAALAGIVLACFSACSRGGPGSSDGAGGKTEAPGVDAIVSGVSGEKVYVEHCATCHMADGYGVPNMQPGLVGSPIVTGDPEKLYTVIRGGSAALRDRPAGFGNEMPPFGMLSEAEVRAVMEYVRRHFARPAP